MRGKMHMRAKIPSRTELALHAELALRDWATKKLVDFMTNPYSLAHL